VPPPGDCGSRKATCPRGHSPQRASEARQSARLGRHRQTQGSDHSEAAPGTLGAGLHEWEGHVGRPTQAATAAAHPGPAVATGLHGSGRGGSPRHRPARARTTSGGVPPPNTQQAQHGCWTRCANARTASAHGNASASTGAVQGSLGRRATPPWPLSGRTGPPARPHGSTGPLHRNRSSGCASPPPNGGVRQLGGPWVVARLLPHALWQGLQPRWAPTCSEPSDGLRPGRSAPPAVAQAQPSMADGSTGVGAIDRAPCVARVCQDRLRARLAGRLPAKRVLQRSRAC
jgi:hypothetical protein